MSIKLKHNLWRLWSLPSLGYIVLWYYLLLTWYLPEINAPAYVVLTFTEAMAAILFCTGGLAMLIFAFVVLWATLKR